MNAETLIKRHAYPFFFAPYDVARQMRTVSDQSEMLRDSDGTAYFQGSAAGRDIADRASDCAAVELDRSGFQDAVPRGSPVLHEIGIPQKPKESIARSISGPPIHVMFCFQTTPLLTSNSSA
jgi:hypothetical protein